MSFKDEEESLKERKWVGAKSGHSGLEEGREVEKKYVTH